MQFVQQNQQNLLLENNKACHDSDAIIDLKNQLKEKEHIIRIMTETFEKQQNKNQEEKDKLVKLKTYHQFFKFTTTA